MPALCQAACSLNAVAEVRENWSVAKADLESVYISQLMQTDIVKPGL